MQDFIGDKFDYVMWICGLMCEIAVKILSINIGVVAVVGNGMMR